MSQEHRQDGGSREGGGTPRLRLHAASEPCGDAAPQTAAVPLVREYKQAILGRLDRAAPARAIHLPGRLWTVPGRSAPAILPGPGSRQHLSPLGRIVGAGWIALVLATLAAMVLGW